jgi:thiol-disulfide isomerase/thioredoxin
MKPVFSFLKKHFSDLLLIFIILFFIFTGKFALLKDKIEAWSGKDQGLEVADMQFNYLQNNERVNLSELKGKVVLINFWATWCPPCRVEIPGLVDIYGRYREKGLQIVGVSIDSTGSGPVRDFVRNEKISYPVSMASHDILGKFDEIVAVPTSFLLDKEGRIVKKYPGFYLKSTFENDIKQQLEKN